MKRAFWDASEQDRHGAVTHTSLETIPAEVLACIVERGQLTNWFQTLSCVSRRLRAVCRSAERSANVWPRLSRSVFPRVTRLGPDAAMLGGSESPAAWRFQFYTLVRWTRWLDVSAAQFPMAAAATGWFNVWHGGLLQHPIEFPELIGPWSIFVRLRPLPAPDRPLGLGEFGDVGTWGLGFEMTQMGVPSDEAPLGYTTVLRVLPAAIDQATADAICRQRMREGNVRGRGFGTCTYTVYV